MHGSSPARIFSILIVTHGCMFHLMLAITRWSNIFWSLWYFNYYHVKNTLMPAAPTPLSQLQRHTRASCRDTVVLAATTHSCQLQWYTCVSVLCNLLCKLQWWVCRSLLDTHLFIFLGLFSHNQVWPALQLTWRIDTSSYNTITLSHLNTHLGTYTTITPLACLYLLPQLLWDAVYLDLH